jgi:hypothetical protein
LLENCRKLGIARPERTRTIDLFRLKVQLSNTSNYFRIRTWRADRAGSHIGTFCNLLYSQLGEPGIRRILGILSLAKKFGTAAVDDACSAALEMGVHEYRFVRRYLERGPQLTLRQVDPLIRELVHYRDLIHKTQEQEE